MPIKNQTQLITYPDSLGGDLQTLNDLLQTQLAEVFPGGVHILPPFPSSADRGFAPMTYFEIEPRFGDWDDIRQISQQTPVMLDLMANHISRQSTYFQDFLKHGRRSPYADLFITLDKIWPDTNPPGSPPPEDVAKIFLRKPEHPFSDVVVADTGETERVWTTFGRRDWSEQVDLDVHSPATRALFRQILAHFSRYGVRLVRLDAIAYITKKPGTSCFFVEPEIYDFLEWISAQAQAVGIDLLLEVHAHPAIQARLAAHGYWVYNFVLPFLVLHSLLHGSAEALGKHLRSCPRRQFTMLDCHDGIPVQPDLDGVLEIEAARQTVQACLGRGANLSRILSAEHLRHPGFDAHQVNCSYYSALGADDDRYLAARAIQFFAPGVPQVYYAGLLAAENAPQEVARSGDGRAINRPNYSIAQVEAALRKPVVQRLLKLIHFRNTYPAFDGQFSVLQAEGERLMLAWERGEHRCELRVDLAGGKAEIEYGKDGVKQVYRP